MNVERLVIRPQLSREDFLKGGGLAPATERGAGDGEKYQDDLREEASRLFDRCSGLVRPKALWGEGEVWVVDEEDVWLDEERFQSRCLASNLRGYDRIVVFLATCGTELEELASGGDSLSQFWVDLIKGLALDAVVRDLKRAAAVTLGSPGVASMNPGSADADVWPIEQQQGLFRLLGDTESMIGVVLTRRFLMIPNKSLSGILFPSDAGWVSCRACSRLGCVARRASFQGRGQA